MDEPTSYVDGDELVVPACGQDFRLSLVVPFDQLEALLDYQESDEQAPSWRAEVAMAREKFMPAAARDVVASIPDGMAQVMAVRLWMGALNLRLGKYLTSSLAGAAAVAPSPGSSVPASASPRTKRVAKP